MNEIKAILKKVQSKKNGQEYIIIEIPISNDYKKTVFLDPAEKALVKLQFKDI